VHFGGPCISAGNRVRTEADFPDFPRARAHAHAQARPLLSCPTARSTPPSHMRHRDPLARGGCSDVPNTVFIVVADPLALDACAMSYLSTYHCRSCLPHLFEPPHSRTSPPFSLLSNSPIAFISEGKQNCNLVR